MYNPSQAIGFIGLEEIMPYLWGIQRNVGRKHLVQQRIILFYHFSFLFLFLKITFPILSFFSMT